MKRSQTRNKKIALYATALAAVMLAAGAFYIKTSSKPAPSSQAPVTPSSNSSSSGSSNTTGQPPTPAQDQNTTPATNSSPNPSTAGLGTATDNVIVSDSNSNQQPATSRGQTVLTSCRAQGASNCWIEFVNGSQTVALNASSYTCGGSCWQWQWTANNANLPGGTWKVYAVATINNQTYSSSSPDIIYVESTVTAQ